MSRLWVFVQAYLDSQGGMSSAALARKIGIRPQTVNTWKIRGSRPEPGNLRDLATAIDVDYAILLAAIETDGGYITDDDLDAVLDSRKWISPEMRERLRRHVNRLSTDNPDKPDTGLARR